MIVSNRNQSYLKFNLVVVLKILLEVKSNMYTLCCTKFTQSGYVQS